MNDKIILILLKILGQIHQDNPDARNGIEKSIATVWKEEDVSFEQVFYILSFLYIYIYILLYLPEAFRVENSF